MYMRHLFYLTFLYLLVTNCNEKKSSADVKQDGSISKSIASKDAIDSNAINKLSAFVEGNWILEIKKGSDGETIPSQKSVIEIKNNRFKKIENNVTTLKDSLIILHLFPETTDYTLLKNKEFLIRISMANRKLILAKKNFDAEIEIYIKE